MPYVKPIYRPKLDAIVEHMKTAELHPGDLNYILFKYCKSEDPSYKKYRNFIGEINESVAEIRRRILAPYEDMKKKQNGDVESED